MKRPSWDQYEFCNNFVADIKAGQNIEVVEPLFITQDYNDSLFQPYKSACPNMDLNTFYDLPFRRLPEEKAQQEEELDERYERYYATENLKLYHFDINRNGLLEEDDYVFHGERYYSDEKLKRRRENFPDKVIPNSGGYIGFGSDLGLLLSLDLNECKREGKHSVSTNFDSFRNKSRKSVVAIIDYSDKFYYLNLYDLSVIRMSLWEKGSGGYKRQSCVFEAN